MNKAEFLQTLSYSLKDFKQLEVDRVICYYNEIISDRVESGIDEYRVVAELGDIKTISKQIQAELAEERLKKGRNDDDILNFRALPSTPSYNQFNQDYKANIDKETVFNPTPKYVEDKKPSKKGGSRIFSGTLLTILLFPFVIVLFSILFSFAVAIFSIIFGLGAGIVALAVAIIPVVINTAPISIGGAVIWVGAILLAMGILGLIMLVFAKFGPMLIRACGRGTRAFFRLLYGGKQQ